MTNFNKEHKELVDFIDSEDWDMHDNFEPCLRKKKQYSKRVYNQKAIRIKTKIMNKKNYI